MEGLLNYLDAQIDAVRDHAAAALEAFDEKSVHQARVATRRLKAGLELLEPLVARGGKTIGKSGKQLRRRLGPLRDLDVMIDLVGSTNASDKVSGALGWLAKTLENQRRDARLHDHDHGGKPAKLIARFDAWWKLRHDLQANLDAISPLLTAALHERFERFATRADWVSGRSNPPEDQLPIDVHQVRIEGKALRYTLEMADAAGLKLPKKLHKTFKALQQSLGDWHDYVVIYDRMLAMMVEEELALHAPELANSTLDLAKIFLRRSITSLDAFRAQWKKSCDELATALKRSVPLITDPNAAAEPAPVAPQDVAVADGELVAADEADPDEADEDKEDGLSESETDPDLLATESTELSAIAPGDAAPETPM